MTASAAACPFCQPAQLVTQNNLAYAVVDKHPVTPGHALIVPYRQVADYFGTTQTEKVVLRSLIDAVKTILDAKPHPRYRGDMEGPRGGVCGAIPKKQFC